MRRAGLDALGVNLTKQLSFVVESLSLACQCRDADLTVRRLGGWQVINVTRSADISAVDFNDAAWRHNI